MVVTVCFLRCKSAYAPPPPSRSNHWAPDSCAYMVCDLVTIRIAGILHFVFVVLFLHYPVLSLGTHLLLNFFLLTVCVRDRHRETVEIELFVDAEELKEKILYKHYSS